MAQISIQYCTRMLYRRVGHATKTIDYSCQEQCTGSSKHSTRGVYCIHSAREILNQTFLMQEDCTNALARHTTGMRRVVVDSDDESTNTRLLAGAGNEERARILARIKPKRRCVFPAPQVIKVSVRCGENKKKRWRTRWGAPWRGGGRRTCVPA